MHVLWWIKHLRVTSHFPVRYGGQMSRDRDVLLQTSFRGRLEVNASNKSGSLLNASLTTLATVGIILRLYVGDNNFLAQV
jgi:hypothetical protein